jgi:HD-like signal output (HDOD) protein
LAFDKFVPTYLDDAISTARHQDTTLKEAEIKFLGYHHGQIGGLLADKWNLSKLVRQAVQFHESPEEDTTDQQSTLVIAAANEIAYSLGFPSMPGIKGLDEGVTYLDKIGLTEEQLMQLMDTVALEVERADEAMSSPRRAA